MILKDPVVEAIEDTFKYLDHKGVYFLQFDSYNEEEDGNFSYVKEYNSLIQNLIFNKIFKHYGISIEKYQKGEINDFYFDHFFLAEADDKWFGKFMAGDEVVYFEVDPILEGDYSELDYALSDIAA